MLSFRYSTTVLLSIASIMISLSCSSITTWARLGTDPVGDAIRQARAHLALNEYGEALEIYSGVYDKRRHDPALLSSYVGTGEQIRNAADKAYQRGDFTEAGCLYGVLLGSGMTAKDFANSLSFDSNYLNRQVKTCSKAQMEIGLMKYREGKLDEAISLWKKVLIFDPDNKGVKSAIETATIQLQKLKDLE